MSNRMLRRFVWLGSLVAVSFAVGFLTLAKRVGPAKQFTIHVSGTGGTPVSCAFEIDGLMRDAEQAKIPATFNVCGRAFSFTVRRVGGPDRPVCVTVDANGVTLGTGTAGDGIRCSFTDGPAEAQRLFLAAVEPADESEPNRHHARRDGREPAEQADQTPRGPRPDLIGTRPPEWTLTEWLNSEPLQLADLRGKVVLVRWFTGPH